MPTRSSNISARATTALRTIYEHLAIADIRAAADVLRPVYERDAGPRRLCQPRMLALSRQRHRGHGRGGAAAVAGGGALQSDGEGSGDPGRHSRHSPADRARAEHQYHAAVFRRASTSRWPKPISPGSRSFCARAAMSRASPASPVFSSAASTRPSTSGSTGSPIEQAADRLRGKAAIANAKIAYQRYKALFSGPRWQALADAGARPQRLLWASTSTKNPAYRDTIYVDGLIGADTVNTMPPATMDAFRDHGRIERRRHRA